MAVRESNGYRKKKNGSKVLHTVTTAHGTQHTLTQRTIRMRTRK